MITRHYGGGHGDRSRPAAPPPIESLLQQLPRERAPESFTHEVLRRLDSGGSVFARRRSRASRVWIGGGLALAASVFLGAVLGPLVFERDDPSPHTAAGPSAYTSEEIHDLRAEYLELQRELRDLQRAVSEAQPIVALGGDDRVDYVVDVRDLLLAEPSTRIRPVSYRPSEVR